MTLNIDRNTWTRVKFGDVIENVSDRVDDPSKAGVDRYVGLEHLDPGSMTVNRWGTPDQVEAQKLRFVPGDVIFGRRRAYQRKVAMADFEGICSAHALVLRARPGRIDPAFLPVFLSSDAFLDRAVKISVGSLSPTVNWKTLAAQEFELPPLEDQRRIAELLWAVEDCRRTTHDLKSAVDVCASLDFVRLLESAGGATVAVGALIDGKPRNGLSLPATAGEGGIPTLSLSAVRDGQIVSEGSLKWVAVDEARVKPFRMEAGDFYIVRGNGNRDLVARAALLRAGDVPADCFYPDLLIRLRFKADKIDPEFALAQWNSTTSRSSLLSVAKSSNGIYKVNGADVSSHRLKVPSLSEQREIMDRVSQHAAARTASMRELKSLDDLSQRLRNELLEGGK